MLKAAVMIAACGLVSGCGAPKVATVKGSFKYAGKPFVLPADAGEVFISLYGIGEDDKIDVLKKYAGVVKQDGTFEIVSSAGELPTGTYRWSIESAAGRVKEFEPFTSQKSQARIELKPGPNQIVFDLSQRN